MLLIMNQFNNKSEKLKQRLKIILKVGNKIK